MIPLKSEQEIHSMQIAGKISSAVMQQLRRHIKAGILTAELDHRAEELVRKENAACAFKGYKGFPANICTSVNEEVVHGIPGEKKLKEGDIVSLDLGINYRGYFSDAAITVAVGRIDSKAKRLIEVSKRALALGIKQARINNHISDISYAIQNYVEKNRFSVVRQFVGHGIGKQLHEEPEIPDFGQPHQGELIKKGMVFAIESMVNMGNWECKILDNGWTAVTKDGLPSAHFEETVVVTEDGPEIITR